MEVPKSIRESFAQHAKKHGHVVKGMRCKRCGGKWEHVYKKGAGGHMLWFLEPNMTICRYIPPTKEELIKRCKARYDSSDLDEVVIDHKAVEASNINNAGIDAQLEYIYESGGMRALTELVEEEEDG